MRRGLAWVAVVVGAVATLVGVLVAVVVGPDDTVTRPAHELPSEGSTALMAYSSWPRLLAYRDLTLEVTARGGGSVLVGTANPIDAASYAEGVRSYRFSEVSTGGWITSGRVSDGSRTQPAVAPAEATFWITKAEGSGEARLRVPLDGTPVSVVAVSQRGMLEMGFGVRFAGLFWTAVAVLLIGLLLTRYGVSRLRRPPMPEGMPSRLAGATSGGLALLLLASGCGWVPETVEPRAPTKIPLVTSELQRVLDDYDRRNNAAVEAVLTRLDGRLSARAVGGSVLAGYEFETGVLRATGKRSRAVTRHHRGVGLYAPTSSSYPLAVVVTSDEQVAGSSAKERVEQREYVSADVLSRSCATCPWVMTVGGLIPRGKVPSPLPVGDRSVPTSSQRRTAAQFRDDLSDYLRVGRSARVTPAGGLADFRRRYTEADSFERVELHASPYDDGGIHLVRVAGGALVLVQHAFTSISTPKTGTLVWNDRAFATALNQTGDQLRLTQGGVLTTTALLPDSGNATVLDASWTITGP